MLSTLEVQQIEENATDKIIIIAKVCKCLTSCRHPRMFVSQNRSEACTWPPLWVKHECRSVAQPGLHRYNPTEDGASLTLPG